MTETQFEDRLLAELRKVVTARAAHNAAHAALDAAEGAPARRPGRRQPRLLLAGAAVAATAATAFILAAGGDHVTPAFAIERQPGGSVTVTINRLSDASGLEQKLRAAGVAAVVDYTPLGKTCRQPRGRPAAAPGSPAGGRVSGSSVNGRVSTFTISRNMVGPGESLVITTSGGAGPTSVGMQVMQGRVLPCELVDAPSPPPPGSSGSFSTHGPARGTSTGTESRSLSTSP